MVGCKGKTFAPCPSYRGRLFVAVKTFVNWPIKEPSFLIRDSMFAILYYILLRIFLTLVVYTAANTLYPRVMVSCHPYYRTKMGVQKLAAPRHFLLKCRYQTRIISGHVDVCQGSCRCVLGVMYMCVRGHVDVCKGSCRCVLRVI